MEGCTGIVHNDQLVPGGFDYNRGRELMTGDVVAAAEAALSFEDVTQVRICDGHGTMRNVLIERLPSGTDLVTGPASSRTMCQVEGLDDGFDAVLCVGYHAMAGTPGALLSHTWIGSIVSEVRVNGRPFGETALNAGIAGDLGIPVVFLSGDEAACDEARTFLGDRLVTVPVKRAFGAKSAVCRTPSDTAEAIRLGVLTALEGLGAHEPLRIEGPVEVAVSFHRTDMADRGAKRPGVERSARNELSFSRPTFTEAARETWALLEWTAGDQPEWLR
jgi:D-amino peptidase